jgi:putative NADPH-quinone reductase
MNKQIVVIDGHPDADPARFCHVLAAAYAEAANASGHVVRSLHVARLNFPLLRSRAEWETGALAPDIASAQQAIAGANHVVLIFPLWLGDMPALLKGFLEQVFRPGFAISEGARTLSPGLLKGKSAHVIITMGMPAFVYRLFFFAHSVRSLRRNILRFVGFAPIRQSIIGSVEANPGVRAKWLDRIRAHAREGT